MSDFSSDGDAAEQVPVPGPLMFGLLLLVMAGFILPPCESDIDLATRSICFNPVFCLHEVLECLAQLIEFVLCLLFPSLQPGDPPDAERTRGEIHGSNFDESLKDEPALRQSSQPLQNHAIYSGCGLRAKKALQIMAPLSWTALWTVDNAPWTQRFATLYAVRYFCETWAAHREDNTPRSFKRGASSVASAIAAVICNWAIWHNYPLAQVSQYYLALSNGVFAALAASIAAIERQRQGHVFAMLGQVLHWCFSSFMWLLVFHPAASWARHNLSTDEEPGEKQFERYVSAAVLFQAGNAIFLMSRDESINARKPVKLALALLWLATVAWYHFWWFSMYEPVDRPYTARDTIIGRLREWM